MDHGIGDIDHAVVDIPRSGIEWQWLEQARGDLIGA